MSILFCKAVILPKLALVTVEFGSVEVGVVQGVECLEPDLQEDSLSEVKVLLKRGIQNVDSGSRDNVATGVAVGTLRLKREGIGVKPFFRRRVGEVPALTGDYARQIVRLAGISLVYAIRYAERETGLKSVNRTDLPAADQRAGDTVIEVRVAFADRQVVECRDDKAVARVKR